VYYGGRVMQSGVNLYGSSGLERGAGEIKNSPAWCHIKTPCRRITDDEGLTSLSNILKEICL
jgi:hypothetical protein